MQNWAYVFTFFIAVDSAIEIRHLQNVTLARFFNYDQFFLTAKRKKLFLWISLWIGIFSAKNTSTFDKFYTRHPITLSFCALCFECKRNANNIYITKRSRAIGYSESWNFARFWLDKSLITNFVSNQNVNDFFKFYKLTYFLFGFCVNFKHWCVK